MKTGKIFFSILVMLFVTDAYSQCFISGFGNLGQLYKTTGNPTLDSKFNLSKIDLERLFGITTDLYVYNDGNTPNAYATRSRSSLVDGMVAFGQTMLVTRLWRMDKGEYAVAGVLAHEFAHVLQIKRGNSLPTKEKELQADFLAGYYFGKRNFLSQGLSNFATDLFELGDYNFWHPQHHGTPQERVDAMLEGYKHRSKTISEAYAAGIRYVTGDGIDDPPAGGGEGEPEEECSRCEGEGKATTTTTCSSCRGAGAMACLRCGGNGGAYAYGSNTFGQYGLWWFTCGTCAGNRQVSCTRCDGEGERTTSRTCYSCSGTGRQRRH